MRGGGAPGEELTGRRNRKSADWAVRKELDQNWPLIGPGGPRRRGRHAREGGRASGAGLPASRSSYERCGSGSQLDHGPALRSAALRLGFSGGEARRSDAGSRQRAREAGQRGRGALRCRRVLAGCCGPRARGARRRAHYAGGLPAAAMASRAPLRAAHSPQGPRGQAAPAATGRAPLPSAGCCPLPPGRNSSSRPGLLLLLLLLLQDVGAQQGEWWPGRVGLQRLLAVEGTWGRTERCCYTTLYVPRGGSATLCLKFVPLYFSARPFISLKRGTWDTAMEASFLSPPGLMDGVGSKWKSI